MTKLSPEGITSKEAATLLSGNARAVLFDIRSSMEFLFVGHPKGAIHVPWIDEPDWKINTSFASQVRQIMLGGISKSGESDAPTILICRSGKRSLEAGQLLLKEGFKQVYHVIDGFEGELDDSHHRSTTGGWRFYNLPWEQC